MVLELCTQGQTEPLFVSVDVLNTADIETTTVAHQTMHSEIVARKRRHNSREHLQERHAQQENKDTRKQTARESA